MFDPARFVKIKKIALSFGITAASLLYPISSTVGDNYGLWLTYLDMPVLKLQPPQIESKPTAHQIEKRKLRNDLGYTSEKGWECFPASEYKKLGPATAELSETAIGIDALNTLMRDRPDICRAPKEVFDKKGTMVEAFYSNSTNTIFFRTGIVSGETIVHEIRHVSQNTSTDDMSCQFFCKEWLTTFILANMVKEAGSYATENLYAYQKAGDDTSNYKNDKTKLPAPQTMDLVISQYLETSEMQNAYVETSYEIAKKVLTFRAKHPKYNPVMFDPPTFGSEDIRTLATGKLLPPGVQLPMTAMAINELVVPVQERLKQMESECHFFFLVETVKEKWNVAMKALPKLSKKVPSSAKSRASLLDNA